MSMRVSTGQVRRSPYAERVTCIHGHHWTDESTRWRIRWDKGEQFATRDCLACKRISEGQRRRRRAADRSHR